MQREGPSAGVPHALPDVETPRTYARVDAVVSGYSRALLVQPRATRSFWGWSPPPVGLLSLAAMAPEQTTVADCAQSGEDEYATIDRFRPEVVGATAFTATRHAALNILAHAKARGAVTVLGGPHLSDPLIARQVAEHYPHVDHIVRRGGELVWRDILAGRPVPRVVMGRQPVDFDELPIPAWDKVPVLEYPARDSAVVRGLDLSRTPRVSVVFSRGCPGRCAFCDAWRQPRREHGPAWIRQCLTALRDIGVRYVSLDDDCLTDDPERFGAVCSIMRALGLIWQCEIRADMLTEDMAREMAASGCWQIAVGLESGSPRVLELMNKQQNLAAVLQARRYCWTYGLRFVALVMVGYPGATEEDEEATRRFIRRLQPDDVGTLGYTIILPYTGLHADAVAEGRIGYDYWLGPERECRA